MLPRQLLGALCPMRRARARNCDRWRAFAVHGRGPRGHDDLVRSRLFFHIIWTTRGRQPLLNSPAARFLDRYLRAVARQERSQVIALGMVRTHVHVLIETHPTTSLPRLVQRFKGGSSVLLNREGHIGGGRTIRWAKGYAIHTVGPRGLSTARAYVLDQGSRHPGERIAETTEAARPVALVRQSAPSGRLSGLLEAPLPTPDTPLPTLDTRS
jgi:putative transposase